MKTHEKIEVVLRKADKPLALHEFASVIMEHGETHDINGREYIGCSEIALARRLLEMRHQYRVIAKKREGKAFLEYELVRVPPAVTAV